MTLKRNVYGSCSKESVRALVRLAPFYPAQGERGVALLMTVFVVALATILVMDTLRTTQFYQRSSRTFTENIQADFVLKSALSLSTILLELPQQEENKDPLGEVFIPIPEFAGELRLMIVDEDSKIDVNSIAQGASSYFSSGSPIYGGNETSSSNPITDFWKNSLREVFARTGFQREQFAENEYRTLGNMAYDASTQVAVIHDWIDADSKSHRTAAFDGQGIESGSDKKWFYNRSFRTLSELALVPGMTLDRVARIAPFVRVSQDLSNADKRVNVNTAPFEVLVALGFSEDQALEIQRERTDIPLTMDELRVYVEGHPQLRRMTKVNSGEFSIYARANMANTTRWMKAIISLQRRSRGRKAFVRSVEFY